MTSIPDHDEVELLEKQLFQSLSRDEPPVKAKHVAAAALGLGSAALTSATAAEGAAVGSAVVKAGPLFLLKWVGIGTVAGVVSLGAVRAVAPRSSAPPPVVTAVSAPAAPKTTAPIDPVPSRLDPPIETTQPEEPPAVAQAPHAVRRVADPTVINSQPARAPSSPPAAEPPSPANAPVSPATPTVTSSTLAAEVAMLDQARNAVSAKSGDRALDLLGRYAQKFPSGTLGLEAAVLRIEALYLAGSTAAARALAREFLASHPTSTHASHVRRLVEEHEKP
jgi:hypothetical protein